MNGSAAEEAICLAFRRLLAEMPYDKVTVSAIAEASGLSRQTFYYHFGSVFGIVRRLCIGQIRKKRNLPYLHFWRNHNLLNT